MARYIVLVQFPGNEPSVRKEFKRRDHAADFAYVAIRAHYESQALLDRPCVWRALGELPDDLRTIPVAECGRKILVIKCGDQRQVSINAGRVR